LFYIGRDYQGSITHIFNEEGTVKQELSYDAWGRLRDPASQRVYPVDREPELFLGRGYTGHEHLTPFGLINMNARLYDAAIGRFLSPDPYIQDMTNSQNYNLYSYVLNNPLKYTDPSGENYYWDSDMHCYRNEWGASVGYGDVYKAMFESGYFRPGGSMWDGTSYGGYGSGGGYGYGYGYGYRSGYPAYVVSGANGARAGYKWLSFATVKNVAGKRDMDGYVYSGYEFGVTSIQVPDMDAWLNRTSNTLHVGSDIYNTLGKLSASEGYWLGNNGKYYKKTWGGNQWTGARSGALKAAKLYKGAGIVVTVLGGAVEIGNGLYQDDWQIGYNTQKAMAGVAGSAGGATLGAWIGGIIGTPLAGVGAIPGAVVGGIVGGWIGSWGGGYAGEAIYDGFVK
jgi:RHS repeat-associated protein